MDNPLELHDNANGSTAFGVNGFQPPSLFSVNYHAPYLHRGQAPTLEEVFPKHALGTSTIQGELNASDRANLLEFLRSIDGTTAGIPSEGDTFRDTLRVQGTCPAPSSSSP